MFSLVTSLGKAQEEMESTAPREMMCPLRCPHRGAGCAAGSAHLEPSLVPNSWGFIKSEELPAAVVQAQHRRFYPVGRIHLEVNGIFFGLLPPLQPQVSGW